ncbi:hypothetical protein ACNSMP_005262, partial [Enterobacter hormaechei]
ASASGTVPKPAPKIMSVSVRHAPISCNKAEQDLFGLDQDRNSHNVLALARLSLSSWPLNP